MRKRVAIIGGGVAGLSAAHELAERDFDVVVLEGRSIPGGKARSVLVPGSGTEGRRDLPGEHGFRFFAGFYRHLPDTMKRIPYRDGASVADNLVATTRIAIAREGAPEILAPTHFPMSLSDLHLDFDDLYISATEIPALELAHFARRLLVILTSCEERRFGEFEYQTWWDFTGADDHSTAYQNFCADGLTRTLVAAKAREMSARTGGSILLQMQFDMANIDNKVDRLLNGPTNDVWITPWMNHLRRLGVDYRVDSPVLGIHGDGHRVSAITVRRPGSDETYEESADYYIAAVPAHIMARMPLDDDLRKAEPRLEGIPLLHTRWMNGVQYYLFTDVPLQHGHTIYMDSEWALTSVSQHQFWPDVDFASLGDGRVRGILSVDVSDWEKPGKNGKPARDCSPKEIIHEVWEQAKAHLDVELPRLVDDDRVSAFIDPDISWLGPSETRNAEPMLVNTAGSWDHRPEVVTSIENFFLAADYVRTYTDLATMEGANEAARRAVNGIIDASGQQAPKCELWKFHEPAALAPVRVLDRHRYKQGKPNTFDER
jgi:uncharacterized protein with NAD-binding domain and iron-sulfur cluster